MPQDECRDCEGFFPHGKGLTEGLCDACRTDREAAGLGTDAEVPPEASGAVEPGEPVPF